MPFDDSDLPDTSFKQKTYPYPKFRGTWNPPALFALMERGLLSPMEFVLLGVIEALSQNGEGCWARNSYFAQMLKISNRHVIRMLKRLKALKIIEYKEAKIHKGRSYRLMVIRWPQTDSYISATGVPAFEDVAPEDFKTIFTRTSRVTKMSQEQVTDMSPRYKDIKKDRSMEVEPTSSIRRNVPFSTNGKPSMAFFEEMLPSKMKKFHIQMAEDLRMGLTKVKRTPRWTKKRWAQSFRLLESEDKVPIVQIQNTLDWFCENVSKISKPTIYNAKHFRTNFRWLTDQMNNDKSGVIPGPESTEFAKELTTKYKWKGTEADLPVAIEITLREFTKLRLRLRDEVLVKRDLNADRRETIEYILSHSSPMKAMDLTRRWFERIQEITKWDKWSGDLIGMAYKGNINHKRLTAIGRELIGSRKWNHVVREIE